MGPYSTVGQLFEFKCSPRRQLARYHEQVWRLAARSVRVNRACFVRETVPPHAIPILLPHRRGGQRMFDSVFLSIYG
jgi:hypothetical protein